MLTLEEAKKLDVVKAMREKARIEDNIQWWFYYAGLWDAIKNHIEKNDKEHCVLIDRLTDPIQICRGTGPDISFRKAWLYAMDYSKKPPKEADIFALDINVTYYDKDTLEHEYPDSILRDYTINVPLELARNFTQKAFDKWISELRKEKNKGIQEQEVKELKRLMVKYPKQI